MKKIDAIVVALHGDRQLSRAAERLLSGVSRETQSAIEHVVRCAPASFLKPGAKAAPLTVYQPFGPQSNVNKLLLVPFPSAPEPKSARFSSPTQPPRTVDAAYLQRSDALVSHSDVHRNDSEPIAMKRQRIAEVVRSLPSDDKVVLMETFAESDAEMAEHSTLLAEAAHLAMYSFPKTFLKKRLTSFSAALYDKTIFPLNDTNVNKLKQSGFSLNPKEMERDEAFESGAHFAYAENLARFWAEAPANRLTPKLFADAIKKRFADVKAVTVEVHDDKWIKKQKMGGLMAVAQGSENKPRFVVLKYNGKNDDSKPIALVGKGVTFDTGGICIKPAKGMFEMKADMTGAAAVASAVYGLAASKAPVNVFACIPMAENMPSSTAYKPGDVLTMMDGRTVEIDNTDAEGRLLLADAVTYAERNSGPEFPQEILTVATLTGAVLVSLGSRYFGVFSSRDREWQRAQAAARRSGTAAWRLPLDNGLGDMLKSNVAAQVNNSRAMGAGSSTAAWFVRSFSLSGVPFSHWDIAGVMTSSSSTGWLPKGMTGLPTRALMNYVIEASKTDNTESDPKEQ